MIVLGKDVKRGGVNADELAIAKDFSRSCKADILTLDQSLKKWKKDRARSILIQIVTNKTYADNVPFVVYKWEQPKYKIEDLITDLDEADLVEIMPNISDYQKKAWWNIDKIAWLIIEKVKSKEMTLKLLSTKEVSEKNVTKLLSKITTQKGLKDILLSPELKKSKYPTTLNNVKNEIITRITSSANSSDICLEILNSWITNDKKLISLLEKQIIKKPGIAPNLKLKFQESAMSEILTLFNTKPIDYKKAEILLEKIKTDNLIDDNSIKTFLFSKWFANLPSGEDKESFSYKAIWFIKSDKTKVEILKSWILLNNLDTVNALLNGITDLNIFKDLLSSNELKDKKNKVVYDMILKKYIYAIHKPEDAIEILMSWIAKDKELIHQLRTIAFRNIKYEEGKKLIETFKEAQQEAMYEILNLFSKKPFDADKVKDLWRRIKDEHLVDDAWIEKLLFSKWFIQLENNENKEKLLIEAISKIQSENLNWKILNSENVLHLPIEQVKLLIKKSDDVGLKNFISSSFYSQLKANLEGYIVPLIKSPEIAWDILNSWKIISGESLITLGKKSSDTGIKNFLTWDLLIKYNTWVTQLTTPDEVELKLCQSINSTSIARELLSSWKLKNKESIEILNAVVWK